MSVHKPWLNQNYSVISIISYKKVPLSLSIVRQTWSLISVYGLLVYQLYGKGLSFAKFTYTYLELVRILQFKVQFSRLMYLGLHVRYLWYKCHILLIVVRQWPWSLPAVVVSPWSKWVSFKKNFAVSISILKDLSYTLDIKQHQRPCRH